MSLVSRPAQNHPQQVKRRGALDKVDDRRTPRDLFRPLHKEFGFTLDVAASYENALVPDYYDRDADGLSRDWYGVVWCNPPYSDIRAWVEKAWQEWRRSSDVETIVMLLPANRTEQAWWQDLIEPERDDRGRLSVRFLRGRLRFDTPEGTYTDPRGNRPPFGCCLVIWS